MTNKFRIERIEWPEGEYSYYVQHKWLCFWLTVTESWYGLAEMPRIFRNIKEAEEYIKKYSFKPKTIIL